MTAPLSADELRVWHAWKSAADAVRSRVAEDLSDATALSDPDFGVLSRLDDQPTGSLQQNELAASMGWHRSRLSHQLSRMGQRDLVTRTALGGGVRVSITETGRVAIAAARPVHAAAVRKYLLDRLDPADRHRAEEIFRGIAAS